MMLLKFYFWILLVFYTVEFILLLSAEMFAMPLLKVFFPFRGYLYFIICTKLISLLPLHGLINKRVILNRAVWNYLLLIQIIVILNIILYNIDTSFDRLFYLSKLSYVLFISLAVINYFYLYKSKEIWGDKKSNMYLMAAPLAFGLFFFAGYFHISKINNETPFCQGDDFFRAAEKGDIDKIKTCLFFGKNINSTLGRSYGRKITALHLAGYSGRYDIAKYLIDNGADINFKSEKNGVSPLWYSSSHLNIVKLLIDNGAEINDSEQYGSATFSKVVRRTNIEIIEYLLSKGALLDSEGAICNAVSSQYKNTLKTVSFLIRRGIDINRKNAHGSTALHCALGKRPEVIKFLIKSGSDLDVADKTGKTPIFYANERSINYLIEAGANLNFPDKNGDTPIFWALKRLSGNTVIALINGGADVNIKNRYGLSPLIVAALTTKNAVAIEHLIEAGADIEASSSIDMINTYLKRIRKKPVKTDKLELTAYDIAVINWGIYSNLSKILK